MNVRLAAKVLSESMYVALLQFASPDAKGTAEYCLMFLNDKFFDCINVRNSVEHIHKRTLFLASFTPVDDDRFSWLLDTFLPYLECGINCRPPWQLFLSRQIENVYFLPDT